MKLSDALIRFLKENIDKPVTIVLKQKENPIEGILIGFDGSVLLLNCSKVSRKHANTPAFVDIDWVCVITTPEEGSLDRYKEAFKEFQKEYEASKKIMRAVYAGETT